MTVLTAMQAAAIRIYSREPQVFFGSSDTFELELCDLVNEVAQDIAEYQDWQALIRLHNLVGDGSTDEFDLPTDYSRFKQDAEMMTLNTWFWGYFHYHDLNAFLWDKAHGWPFAVPGGWVMYDNKIRFAPSPPPVTPATFTYVTKNIVRDSSGQTKERFDSDTDTFILPERLLTLGLIYRFRANKGLEFEGDELQYNKALSQYGTKDTGPTIIRRGQRRFFGNARIAYPGFGS